MTAKQLRQQNNRDPHGKYQERAYAEPELDTLEDRVEEFRLQQLASGAYVPATTRMAAGIGVGDAESWWSNALTLGEHQTADKFGHLKIDEFEDSGRRTQRRRYSAEGVEIQMPAVSAVRRFANRANGQAFDVPVRATLNGKTADMWVRVQPTVDGTYSVTPIGASGAGATQIAEGVNTLLEAGRVTTALEDAGDLMSAHKERLAKTPVGHRLTKIDSWIDGAAHDPSTATSFVKIGAKVYGYRLDQTIHSQVFASAYPGTLYNAMIKNRADRVEVTVCTDCQRVYRADASHVCLNPAPAHQTGAVDKWLRMVSVMTLKTRRANRQRTRQAAAAA